MKTRTKFVLLVVPALCAVLPGAVHAQAELAQARNCLNCHQVDHKVLGPAFKDVAARYAGQPDAPAKLAAKIQKGGAGSWGNLPMPANPQVSDADAKALVTWILSLDKAK